MKTSYSANPMTSPKRIILLVVSTFLLLIVSDFAGFCQGSEQDMINATTVDYDDCTGIATIEMPVNDGYCVCDFQNRLYNVNIYSEAPNGSLRLELSLTPTFLTTGCSSSSPTISGSCWSYRYCNVSNSVNVPTIVGAGGCSRKLVFDVHDLPEVFFGSKTKFRFIGRYDYDQYGAHYDFDYTIETATNQATIGQPQISTVTNEDCRTTQINWTNLSAPGNCGNVFYNIYRDGSYRGQPGSTPFADAGFPLMNPGQTYDYTIQAIWPINPYRTDLSNLSSVKSVTIPQDNGSITVNLRTGSGTPINGKTILATRISYDQTSVCSNFSPLASINLGVTAGNGTVTKNNIYYGHQNDDPTVYRISVAGEPHIPTQDVTLDYTPNNAPNTTLVDPTAYSVTGRLLSTNGCGVAGAQITADGHAPSNVTFITPDVTDQNGDFSLVLPGPDNYGFYSSYETPTGSIIMDSTNMTITVPSGTNVNIQYSKKDTVKGFVGGDCMAIYGPATVNAYSQIGGCLLASTTSDATTGLYELILNAQDVEIKVENYHPVSGPLVGTGPLTQSIDVELDSTTVVDFIFQAPISIEVTGMPDQVCSDISYPILEQGKRYTLFLTVSEGNGCLIDTGYVVIANEISGYDGQNIINDTVWISNGVGVYYLIPATPNIFSPFTKTITYRAYSFDGNSSPPEPPTTAIVVGAAPRGNQFATVSPQIPRIILRDPPGANSYSFIDIGEKFSTTTRMFSQHTEGGNVWAKMKTGIDQRFFGVKLEAGIEVGASISGSKTQISSEETLFEFESTEKIKTSDNNYITGTDGDVYIGAAMNLTYSNSDIISFDLARCEIDKRVELVIQPDSFSTEFALSESYILNFTIPDLQAIVNDVNQSDSDRHLAEQSIKVWRQVINLNARLKEEAFNGPTVQNYTYSNAEIERTFTTNVSETASIEWTSLVEESAGLEAGFALNGTGPSGGFEVNFKQEFGESESNTTSTSTTVGFFFGDDSPNDSYTVDWAFDPVYGTPVFRAANNAGQTSCPWEIGAKRDKPFFSVPQPIQTSGTNSVSFDIWLGNQSETEETRSYELRMVSNPNNAIVQINGTTGPVWLFPNMAYQQPPQVGYEVVNVIVNKPNNEHYQFEGIQFEFYPVCDQYQAAKNSFSVFFDSPCSDISMVSPTKNNGFVVNTDALNEQAIKIGGYTYNDIQSGDQVVLEYAPQGSNSWSTSNIVLSKSQMSNNNPPRTNAIWETDAIEDGLYDIRMKLTCTSGSNQTSTYSPRVSGIIDRTPPEISGTEEPEDDDYEMGDEISVLFNETVVASNATVTLKMIPDDITVTASLILDDNMISVLPIYDISTEIGKVFEVVITDLEDAYNNVADPIRWTFTVGDIDSDGNGYTDTYEQCIGSALHFDATNYVEVPHNTALNVVENGEDFTFSAWVHPADKAVQTIISKGSGSNFFTEYIFNMWTIGGVDHRLGLFLSGQWQHGNTTVPPNQWSHVAATVDGSTKAVTFYINGVPDGGGTYTNTFISGDASPMFIGRQGLTCNCNYFEGRLDDIIIWQHKLTQAEIMATMAGSLAGNETDLVAYYDFNDYESCVINTGNTTLTDKSLNSLDGSLYNFSLDGCSANWATERSMDTDRDGILDGCDEIEDCFDLNDTGDTDGDLLLACSDLCPGTKDVAIDFDGEDDYLYYPSSPALGFLQGDFAFEAWVNPEENSYAPIFAGWEPTTLDLVSFEIRHKRIALFLKDATDTIDGGEYEFSIAEVPLNTWSHVAVSFEAATKKAKFYLNGEFDSERQFDLDSIEYHQFMRLFIGEGHPYGQPYEYFEGRMDDVKVWSRALSEYNVKQSMSAPLAGTENGLTVYLDMNEGQACANNTAIIRATDKSPNAFQFYVIYLDQTNGCSSNWVMGRNADSDGDTIGDACDVSGFGCPPNYAGANKLIGDQEYNTFFDTDGAIESNQVIKDPTGVIYNSSTSVELLPDFEVELGSTLEVLLDGCPD